MWLSFRIPSLIHIFTKNPQIFGHPICVQFRLLSTKTFNRHQQTIFKSTKSFRLCGLSLTLAISPLLRQVQCKSNRRNVNENVSRRMEYMSELRIDDYEPTLSLNDVWLLLRPYFGWFIGAVVSAICAALLNIQLPILLGDLVNVLSASLGRRTGEAATAVAIDFVKLKPIAIQLICSYAAQAALTFTYISFLSVLGERMSTDLRLLLFTRLIHQDMSFYDAQRTGELNARLCNDVYEFKSCFKLCVAQGLRTVTQTGGCIVSLYLISPKMTLITMGVLPVVIAVGTIFGSLLRVLSRKTQAQNALANSVADEAFGNIRTVRAFAMEDAEEGLFKQEVLHAQRLNELLGAGIGLFQGATNLFLNGVVLAVLYGGSQLISTNEITPGDLMSFLVTAQTIQRSLAQFSLLFGQVIKGWTAGARVFEFIHLVPTIPMRSGGRKIPHHSFAGEIRFDKVDFAYPTRPNHVIFNQLDLHIPAGHVVALCGASGQGKSTIAALLERFYEPSSGRITIDGEDIRGLDAQWLRGRAIGLISQEPVLFATTIAENIRYGRPDANDDEVRAAAHQANADTFIESFPNGYHTLVGERGVTLSGGQKQRIAIARALLKNPPVLILDEATSALDSESERLVHEALDRAVTGRTVLIIAHRLSTIRNADLIAVVSDKHIVEFGTPRQLLKQKGHYWQLIRAQQAHADDDK